MAMVFITSMKRPGFTLVEIMLSAGIMAVLTTIVFFNFSRQNQKQALTQAIGTIGTEVQHMTANSQSGILMTTVTPAVTPAQYGLRFELNDSFGAPRKNFSTFGDFQPVATPAALYDNGGTEPLQTYTFQNHVAMYCLSSSTGTEYSRIDLGYALPGAKFTAVGNVKNTATIAAITSEIRITLRDDRTNECQRIRLVPGVTTFSQQKLATCTCS